jgi:hypothetical protein
MSNNTQRSDAPNNGVHGRRHAAPAHDFSLSNHAPERRLDNNLIVNPRQPATRTVRGLSAGASCGRVDPVFRPERCAAQGREHRMDPKSANPLLGPMIKPYPRDKRTVGSSRLPLISDQVANHQGWFLCDHYLRICCLTLSLLKLPLRPLTGKKAQLTLAGRRRDPPDASRLPIDVENKIVADRLWNRHSNCRSRVWIEVGDPGRRNNSASTHRKQDESKAKGECHGSYPLGYGDV